MVVRVFMRNDFVGMFSLSKSWVKRPVHWIGRPIWGWFSKIETWCPALAKRYPV